MKKVKVKVKKSSGEEKGVEVKNEKSESES